MSRVWFHGGSTCSVWVLVTVVLARSARAVQQPPDVKPTRTDQQLNDANLSSTNQQLPDANQTRTDQKPHTTLRCLHPRCRYLGQNKIFTHKYEVEGNVIEITLINYDRTGLGLKLNCNGASLLESPALPRAEPALYVWYVHLTNCPLPAIGSLADTITTLNVRYYERDHSTSRLILTTSLITPTLTAKHFTGLQLRALRVLLGNGMRMTSERGFLTPLASLRELAMFDVTLPADELEAPPPFLQNLELHNTGVKRLSEPIYSSSNLVRLTIVEENPLDAVAVAPGVLWLILKSPATTLRLDAAPALESLHLYNWVEPLPPRVTRCAALRELHLLEPTMHALPDGWLLNCTKLVELDIIKAHNLLQLPSNQFIWPVTRFALRQGALETLPESFLIYLNRVSSLELDGNRLHTLPRFDKFYDMSKLSLSWNNLDRTVLDALAWISEWDKALLTELDLSHNPRIGDVCNANGYSLLRNMTSLRKLRLSGTGVSRICKDWRKRMPRLELLDLRNTSISELSFQDLQYKRDTRSQVWLRGAPVAAVRVTRKDYNKATRAPPSFTSVKIHAELECDCRLYWARRVLDHPRAQLALPGVRNLRCIGGGLLRDLPADKLECGAREECVAAEMPEVCACAARPDDNPALDRWLVRVRCENGLLGFVPRRIYPFYPLDRSKNQGMYLATNDTIV